ncbi:MarR family transcriptional regulator [Natronococcus pandeyae]|uniref:MarR family transcriptional regulator n=1 Tax=Natronococcus pandeyae TaxID=2055836 RepID=A0A8J8Q097_9EURY|nr:helix-turn-helix domain-containing protein [Natronococcus pandeyae]TYL36033.1 MarR family transcriptional regulator [Natronococcus pandeyae]
MSCRQPSLVSRLVARAGRLGRRCITLGEQLRIDSAADPREESGNSVCTVDTAASQNEIQTALVDPGTGPTSRNELLEYGYTPEEYVRVVLEQHDGRFKQRRLVEEYGWSSSTVSRLLTDLEKRGVVDRYRLGREKVVCSPDTAPSAD